MRPDAAHAPQDWNHPCHQSCNLGGAPVGNIGRTDLPAIFNSPEMARMREAHVAGRAADIPVCANCRTAIPDPGSLPFHGRTVRNLLPRVERLAYFGRWSGLRRPKPDLVQIKSK